MKPVVVKFGTGVLSRAGGGRLDARQFRRLAAELAPVIHGGTPCVIVSSAAIAAGVHALGLAQRPGDLPGKQACAAAGQPLLMRMYADSFRPHGLGVAQLLLTHGDIDSRLRRANARNTIERLLAARTIVPIINENDSVAVEELRVGDNDTLSAEVAALIGASRLLLVTSSDGLSDTEGRRIPLVRNLEEAFQHVRPEKGEFSTGGMRSKLEAVRAAHAHGIPATILSGRIPGELARALAGEPVGTRFPLPRAPRG